MILPVHSQVRDHIITILKSRYGLTTADLNLDLGPLGTLLAEP